MLDDHVSYLAEKLTPVVAALPDTIPATPALTLMALGRDNQAYRWETLRQA